VHAGFQPACFDLFADLDLCRVAQASKLACAEYPHGLLNAVAGFSGLPRAYAGGLENHPELIDALSEHGSLWGNSSRALRQVRDPIRLSATLAAEGLATPRVADRPDHVPTDGSWLAKPLASAGGRGIHPYHGGPTHGRCYWQERILGEPHSAVYLGLDGNCRLLGATRQLLGEPACHASRFAYCGSIGPIEPTPAVADQMLRIGNVLARRCYLRGLFGVDLVLDGQTVWTIEVNPRYPASLEILERSVGLCAFAMHASAFRSQSAPATETRMSEPDAPARQVVMGKSILFAPQRSRIHPDAPCYRPAGESPADAFADIPHPGARFEPGDPILTLFATDTAAETCYHRLMTLTRRFEKSALWPLRE
jgi:predicted ATP-grasp superfamily ATP-dependent carboligase